MIRSIISTTLITCAAVAPIAAASTEVDEQARATQRVELQLEDYMKTATENRAKQAENIAKSADAKAKSTAAARKSAASAETFQALSAESVQLAATLKSTNEGLAKEYGILDGMRNGLASGAGGISGSTSGVESRCKQMRIEVQKNIASASIMLKRLKDEGVDPLNAQYANLYHDTQFLVARDKALADGIRIAQSMNGIDSAHPDRISAMGKQINDLMKLIGQQMNANLTMAIAADASADYTAQKATMARLGTMITKGASIDEHLAKTAAATAAAVTAADTIGAINIGRAAASGDASTTDSADMDAIANGAYVPPGVN